MPNILYERVVGSEKEQLHQFARLLRYHVKDIVMTMEDGRRVALGQDMIDLLGKSVLHLSMMWEDA